MPKPSSPPRLFSSTLWQSQLSSSTPPVAFSAHPLRFSFAQPLFHLRAFSNLQAFSSQLLQRLFSLQLSFLLRYALDLLFLTVSFAPQVYLVRVFEPFLFLIVKVWALLLVAFLKLHFANCSSTPEGFSTFPLEPLCLSWLKLWRPQLPTQLLSLLIQLFTLTLKFSLLILPLLLSFRLLLFAELRIFAWKAFAHRIYLKQQHLSWMVTLSTWAQTALGLIS